MACLFLTEAVFRALQPLTILPVSLPSPGSNSVLLPSSSCFLILVEDLPGNLRSPPIFVVSPHPRRRSPGEPTVDHSLGGLPTYQSNFLQDDIIEVNVVAEVAVPVVVVAVFLVNADDVPVVVVDVVIVAGGVVVPVAVFVVNADVVAVVFVASVALDAGVVVFAVFVVVGAGVVLAVFGRCLWCCR